MLYYLPKRLEKNPKVPDKPIFYRWQMSKMVSQSLCVTHARLMCGLADLNTIAHYEAVLQERTRKACPIQGISEFQAGSHTHTHTHTN